MNISIDKLLQYIGHLYVKLSLSEEVLVVLKQENEQLKQEIETLKKSDKE